ncbi:MAG: cupin domain-containing protein [Desulfamplus sp.]|nr:cupin domain-containing protein [Desulfamplus sp.]MBF0413657.1 cupin domain-containing protein [Desulfamplus sp.]
MISVKDAKGKTYDAAKHFGVYGLQKLTEEQSKRTTVCYSYFQPDGGAEMSPSPKERVYYVTKGSITVNGKDGETHVLDKGDMIYIAPGEERNMTINNGKPAEVLVFIVTP